MNELTNDDYVAAALSLQTAEEVNIMNLFCMLKPSLKQEGSQWAVLYGDEKDGIAGFGDSPFSAIMDFNREFYKSINDNDKSKDNVTKEIL